MSNGWIGVDLDGTLAHYDGWKGPEHIGAPVPAMVERVKRWIDAGYEVRIFTARVFPLMPGVPGSGFPPVMPGYEAAPFASTAADAFSAIGTWCSKHLGHPLSVTCIKDYGMIELWDDRAVQVTPNTGEPVGQSTRGLT